MAPGPRPAPQQASGEPGVAGRVGFWVQPVPERPGLGASCLSGGMRKERREAGGAGGRAGAAVRPSPLRLWATRPWPQHAPRASQGGPGERAGLGGCRRGGLGTGQPTEERQRAALSPADWRGWDAPARPGSAGSLGAGARKVALLRLLRRSLWQAGAAGGDSDVPFPARQTPPPLGQHRPESPSSLARGGDASGLRLPRGQEGMPITGFTFIVLFVKPKP